MVVYTALLAQPEASDSYERKMRWTVNEAEVVFTRVKIALNKINGQCIILCLNLKRCPKIGFECLKLSKKNLAKFCRKLS